MCLNGAEEEIKQRKERNYWARGITVLDMGGSLRSGISSDHLKELEEQAVGTLEESTETENSGYKDLVGACSVCLKDSKEGNMAEGE